MTVALVDDEYWIRQGLKAKIAWDELGLTFVGEAAGGREALALLVEEAPDLVFIDIQIPAPDGLEVVRVAQQRCPGTTFVVITGFGEFEYAQKALRYGVKDFLLKPVDPDQLNQTIRRIQTQQETLGVGVAAYVTGQSQIPPEMPAGAPGEEFQVVVLRAGPPPGGPGRDVHRWLRERFTELLGQAQFQLWDEGLFWVVVARLAPDQQNRFSEDLAELGRAFQTAFGRGLSVGLGRPGPFGDTPRSWSQARSAVGNRLLRDSDGPFVAPGEDDGLTLSQVLINRNTVRKLIRLFEDRESEAFFPLLQEVFQGIEQARDRLDFRTLEIVLWRLYTVLIECVPAPQGRGWGPDDFITRIQAAESLSDLEGWFTAAFRDGLASPRAVCHRPDAMEAAREYVEHNYFSDLSLTDMARRFGLNPNYFSQKFKAAVGMGLVDYLRNIRLTRAHQLLKQTRCTVEEAAHGVGYEDPKYFSDLFKSHFGVTPTQFRDTAQE